MYKTVKPTTFTLPLALLEELESLSKELGKKKIANKRLSDISDKCIKADDFFRDLGV